ncbi:hypothetical protein OIU85_027862 [Salix viminalis]|uniref:Uncharacterized protein n=1 Tax=Salix viminalis TaxID=40686 RepID=A0A9Q0QJC2_SALVM|nr:hypothetical protein OIU85_027862 [Salix viminalis]
MKMLDGFTFGNLSEASHGEKPPSAVVVGTVYCDTCFQEDFSRNSHFISGAHVAVECKDEKSRPSFREEAKTDEHGEFKVHLPFSVTKHVKKIQGCSVELLSSSEPFCAVASTATSSSLRLKSRKEGTHIFSAGFFTFKPEKQPFICNQKPRTGNSREFSSRKASLPPVDNPTTFPSPLQDPKIPGLPPVNQNLPPLPLIPGVLPPLPPLPPLPGLPLLPPVPADTKKTKTTESLKSTTLPDEKAVHHTNQFGFPTPPLFPPIIQPPPLFPPILQPPPLFPPILQPPPLFPPVLPPNPLQPSPKPFLPLPPIPGLTPPPPPPFSFLPPLPPFPPLIPGIPPASSSSQKKSP